MFKGYVHHLTFFHANCGKSYENLVEIRDLRVQVRDSHETPLSREIGRDDSLLALWFGFVDSAAEGGAQFS